MAAGVSMRTYFGVANRRAQGMSMTASPSVGALVGSTTGATGASSDADAAGCTFAARLASTAVAPASICPMCVGPKHSEVFGLRYFRSARSALCQQPNCCRRVGPHLGQLDAQGCLLKAAAHLFH